MYERDVERLNKNERCETDDTKYRIEPGKQE